MLHLEYDITGLRGADYNPRKIDAEDLARLGESIRTLGLVKPLIVRGDLLVAGHQRTKALRAIGVDTAPVFVLSKDTTTYDEVRFNQLHNGTDLDMGGEDARIPGGFDTKGYHVVSDTAKIAGNMRAPGATVRMEICDLIGRYGSWGGVVATFSGRVIHAAQYALAAKMLRVPLTVFAIPDEEEDLYRSFLDREYGVFCYDNLKRDTFIQTLAQLPRLREGKANASALYERHVIPWLQLNRGASFIDFGAGQGDYFRRLKGEGFDAYELEFFRRKGMNRTLDGGATQRMIDRMIARLRSHGRFDAVVCDSVLNSVDTVEAERAVVTMLNFLAKPGARVFFAGRSKEEIRYYLRKTVEFQKDRYRRRLEFMDKDGLSGFYREGRWFFQKYHDDADVIALCELAGLKVVTFKSDRSMWQVEAVKERELDREQVAEAIRFEFELPLVGDRRIGRSADMLAVMETIFADLPH